MQLLRAFKWSVLATLFALGAALLYRGVAAAGTVALLIGLEASVSFDNAVVNAGTLKKLSAGWRKLFMTLGILIAVLGMRVVFPVLLVTLATGSQLGRVVHQALYDSAAYAQQVRAATPTLAGFGGAFLLLVWLEFFLDRQKRVHWLGPIERALARAGALKGLPVALVAAVLAGMSHWTRSAASLLLAGMAGIAVHQVVHGLARLMAGSHGGDKSGASGLAGFCYLELLDASFSLDGVLGAFALSKDVLLIGLGLGAGAVYVRSLTVYLVRHEALEHYRYLTHGAHWAIGVMGSVLLLSVVVEVPDFATGLAGACLVGAAFVSSIVHKRHQDPEPNQRPE